MNKYINWFLLIMEFRLNEDFFDDIEQDEIVNADIDNEPDEDKHNFVICVDRLRDTDYNKAYINNNRIREIDKHIRAFCYRASIFNSYKILYIRPGDDLTDYVDINELPTFKYSRFRVKIEYTINKKTTVNQFVVTIQKFAILIYRILSDKFNYRLSQRSLSVNIENENGLPMSHLHKGYLDYVYKTIMGLPLSVDEECDVNKTNYSITKAPRLSPLSKKKLKDMEVGDVLYSTRNGELVLDEETNGKRNIPIAIYVTMNRWSHCPCFVSIRYISNINPKSGSIMPVEMYFGGYGNYTELKHGDSNDNEDPLDLNSQIYDYLNKRSSDCFSTKKFVRNEFGTDHIPPVQSCYHFSPHGTKKGQWYIPNLEQLHELYDNIEEINQTRKNLGYEELAECYFYSCNETSDKQIATLDLSNNREYIHQPKNQQEDLYTIAFINVTESL